MTGAADHPGPSARRGIIDCTHDRAALALVRMLGAPLVAWAARNLRLVDPSMPIAARTADSAPAELLAVLQRFGIDRIGAGEAAAATDHDLHADIARPFCSAESAAALAPDVRSLTDAQQSAIESLDAGSAGGLELCVAVAHGLPREHPCIAGVQRLALRGVDVRAIVCDVDGTLTDGLIYTGTASGEPLRGFHTHDGMAVQLLRDAGIPTALLSATGRGGSIMQRAEMLGVEHVDIGKGHKAERFERLCAQLGAAPANVAYLGDDVNDLPAMELAGLSACPADAAMAVRGSADLVLHAPGGRGALRELADAVLNARR